MSRELEALGLGDRMKKKIASSIVWRTLNLRIKSSFLLFLNCFNNTHTYGAPSVCQDYWIKKSECDKGIHQIPVTQYDVCDKCKSYVTNADHFSAIHVFWVKEFLTEDFPQEVTFRLDFEVWEVTVAREVRGGHFRVWHVQVMTSSVLVSGAWRCVDWKGRSGPVRIGNAPAWMPMVQALCCVCCIMTKAVRGRSLWGAVRRGQVEVEEGAESG